MNDFLLLVVLLPATSVVEWWYVFLPLTILGMLYAATRPTWETRMLFAAATCGSIWLLAFSMGLVWVLFFAKISIVG